MLSRNHGLSLASGAALVLTLALSLTGRAASSADLLAQLPELSCLTADGRTLSLNIETGKVESTWGLLSAEFELTGIRTEKLAEGRERFVISIENPKQSRFNLVFGRIPSTTEPNDRLLGYIEGNTIAENEEASESEPTMYFFGGVACTVTYRP